MTKKRGRKRKNGLYFGDEQEAAVVRYLNEDDPAIRNKIYNEHLREAFNIMVESIIRRYKLYRKDYSFENVHSDTLSYLILKADKFDTSKGKRAFSYYGTICKHYIIGLMIKDTKMLNQTLDFDTSISKVHEKDEFVYHLSDTDYELSDLINTVVIEIQKEIENEGVDGNKKMTENERKVGEALVDILNNWEILFSTLQGGSKFNKNVILLSLREMTNLSTKEIRSSIKRFKKLYMVIQIKMKN